LIRKYLRLRIEGKTRQSIRALHGFLVEHCDYKWTQSALNNHIRECESELWNQCRVRGA
jgi:hypothetical protein